MWKKKVWKKEKKRKKQNKTQNKACSANKMNIIIFLAAFLSILAQKPANAQTSSPSAPTTLPHRIGGWSSLNESNADVSQLVDWSLAHLSQISGQSPTLLHVENIWTQLVDGVKYNFTLAVNYNTANMVVYTYLQIK